MTRTRRLSINGALRERLEIVGQTARVVPLHWIAAAESTGGKVGVMGVRVFKRSSRASLVSLFSRTVANPGVPGSLAGWSRHLTFAGQNRSSNYTPQLPNYRPEQILNRGSTYLRLNSFADWVRYGRFTFLARPKLRVSGRRTVRFGSLDHRRPPPDLRVAVGCFRDRERRPKSGRPG